MIRLKMKAEGGLNNTTEVLKNVGEKKQAKRKNIVLYFEADCEERVQGRGKNVRKTNGGDEKK